MAVMTILFLRANEYGHEADDDNDENGDGGNGDDYDVTDAVQLSWSLKIMRGDPSHHIK